MTQSPQLLSRINFCAFLVYAPRGTTRNCERAKNIVLRIKQDRPPTIAGTVAKMRDVWTAEEWEPFFAPEVHLVPAPRSYPMYSDSLWPAFRVCEELLRAGFAKYMLPSFLKRAARVRKAASAGPGERPTAMEQFLTMSTIDQPFKAPTRITVVDDVVTQGSTLLATASHVKLVYPTSEVRAFALVRTMSDLEDLETMVAPCRGTITLSPAGVSSRRP